MPPLINDHPLTSQSHKYHQFRRAEGGAAAHVHNIVVFIEVLIISTIIKIDRNYIYVVLLSRSQLTSPHLGAAPPPELELGGGVAPHMESGV